MRPVVHILAAASLLATPAFAAPKTTPPAKAPSPAAQPVAAKPAPDLAYGAYQRGLYLTALKEATSRAKANPNDAAALTLLGELYNQGLGVPRDGKEAAAWYRLAAAKGSSHAMAALGMMALEGRGMAKDQKAARDWLEKAAALREPLASFNLALVLLDHGADEDIARAVKLLSIAAAAEIAEAQHALGVVHARGIGGIAQDKAAAARLYLRSAYNGSLAGEVEAAIVLFNGDGIAKDEALAVRHFRHAAARGNAIAQNRLARLLAVGRVLQQSNVESLSWHILAKRQGLQDPWLEERLKDVSAEDRAKAEALAEDRSSL